jgi:hypothetical protein
VSETRAHSIYAPSSSHRWMICPASIVRDSENIPDQPTMQAAIEGTDAHWVAEQALKLGLAANALIGKKMPSGAKCHSLMAKFVQQYLDYILTHKVKLGGAQYYEVRVTMPKIDPEMFGSADCIHITADGALHIYDLKYGHYLVEPKDNAQLMCYALGALYRFKNYIDLAKPVTGHICQPRPTHDDGTFRKAEFTIDQLTKFGKAARQAISKTKVPNPEMVDGDHCALCKREFLCPKLNQIGRKIFI